jgi:predicted Zn-dependent protease with MMP-like domain
MSFEDHVQAALDGLPEEIAGALENVAVVVEDENPEEPDLFGLYDGLGPGRDTAGALPDRIVIYRRPLERDFPDPNELEREIRITVLHEVGHFFGLDEDRIDELGYG